MPDSFSRRQALCNAGLGLVGFSVLESELMGQSALPPFNRFPRMVQEYFVKRLRTHDDEHRRRIMGMRTRGHAEEYVRMVQGKIQQSFGPWPKKTPLKPRVTRVVKRDGYRIENIVFESRPNFLVTANLYLPEKIDKPIPGVVGTCGHSHNGKAAEPYQAFAQGLAKLGYACLIYDPIGQGERLQYLKDDLKSKLRPGTAEHINAGNQQLLVGEFFGSWRAWDGIRALDYLLTRPEIDPKHVGVTGNSGGGTMSNWLAGVEPRWTMAAPSCFVTTFRRNLENELPADSEQCPPDVLGLGLDHCDFLAAMAPKPVVILAKEKDYFDARGAEDAYARLKHLYRLLGKEENVRLFIGSTYHGFSQENREAMYQLFDHATGLKEKRTEPEITIEKDETLWCMPKGQVGEQGSRGIFSFTSAISQRFGRQRQGLRGVRLRSELRKLLNMPEAGDTPEYRIFRPTSSRNYTSRYHLNYAVETEPGIQTVVTKLSDERHYSRPRTAGKKAILYVSHRSADVELREEKWLRNLIQGDTPVFACDVRGIGESQPGTCRPNSFDSPYGCDYFYASHALMLGEPYVGRRTYDVLRVLDWMASFGHTEVHLVAKAWGAIPGAFASVLSDQVKQVTFQGALKSYAAIAESEMYEWPVAVFVPDVLKKLDLPDCYAELKPKNLKLLA
ncbi:MAG: alpha/beta hydrolase family protein [Limisphaerales bacterium]